MKKILFITITAFLAIFYSCQDNSAKVVEKEVLQQVPNPSEIQFGKVVQAYKKGKDKQAASALKIGISELRTEAENTQLSEEARNKEEKAIAALEQLVTPLSEGKLNDLTLLQEAMINSVVNIQHEYLVSSNEFILAKPEVVRSKKINRAFEHSLKLLKTARKDLDQGLMAEADDLIQEGEALIQKRSELDMSIYSELQKLQNFIKRHHSQFANELPYYPSYYGYPEM